MRIAVTLLVVLEAQGVRTYQDLVLYSNPPSSPKNLNY